MLKGQIEIFFDEANILADKMFPMAKSGNAFESSCCVDVAALSTLVRTVFGVDLAIQKHHGMEHPYIQAVETSFQIFTRRICKPWLFFGHKERLREHQTTQKQFIEDILNEIKRRMAIESDKNTDIHLNRHTDIHLKRNEDKTINEEIVGTKTKLSQHAVNDKTVYERNKREISKDLYEEMLHNDMSRVHQQNEITTNNEEDVNHRKRSFVERILRQHMNGDDASASTISEKRLRQEMMGIATAGFDTVKITMAIILNMLAIHPEIQDKVYNEILTVCGDRNDTAPTYDQLLSCQLLTRVIKETVRMFPAASFIARSSPHDIQCGGYTLPAGASFVVFIYGIHRDPQLWPNPHQFDPDRFLPAATVQRNPHAYLPFSLGARNCIGYKYAMIYLKTTLSTVLRRYRVLPGDRCRTEADIRFEFGLTLRLLPGNDIRLEIRRRPSPL
uniref:Cytochrome P450 4c3 n=1 Tax=Cacopsylla melanoneura TaxID=428564 RepID=A0A8D8ZJX1_9HEMI